MGGNAPSPRHPFSHSPFDLLRSRGRRAGGSGFGFSAFQDLLADVLGGGLDVLHLLADARAGGFVAAHGFIHVLFDLGDQLFEFFVLVHVRTPFGINPEKMLSEGGGGVNEAKKREVRSKKREKAARLDRGYFSLLVASPRRLCRGLVGNRPPV